MNGAPDPVLDALWKRVLDGWDDERAHGAFLDYCQSQDRLVEAAVRYRGMSGDHARAHVAEKKLKAVAMLAMSRLEVSRTSAPRARSQALGLSLVVLFISATIGLLAYLGATR